MDSGSLGGGLACLLFLAICRVQAINIGRGIMISFCMIGWYHGTLSLVFHRLAVLQQGETKDIRGL